MPEELDRRRWGLAADDTSSMSSHSLEVEHMTMSSQVWPVTLISAPAAACTAIRPADFSAS